MSQRVTRSGSVFATAAQSNASEQEKIDFCDGETGMRKKRENPSSHTYEEPVKRTKKSAIARNLAAHNFGAFYENDIAKTESASLAFSVATSPAAPDVLSHPQSSRFEVEKDARDLAIKEVRSPDTSIGDALYANVSLDDKRPRDKSDAPLRNTQSEQSSFTCPCRSAEYVEGSASSRFCCVRYRHALGVARQVGHSVMKMDFTAEENKVLYEKAKPVIITAGFAALALYDFRRKFDDENREGRVEDALAAELDSETGLVFRCEGLTMKSPYGDIRIRRNGVYCQSEDQKRCIRVLMPIVNKGKSVDENSQTCWRMMSDEENYPRINSGVNANCVRMDKTFALKIENFVSSDDGRPDGSEPIRMISTVILVNFPGTDFQNWHGDTLHREEHITDDSLVDNDPVPFGMMPVPMSGSELSVSNQFNLDTLKHAVLECAFVSEKMEVNDLEGNSDEERTQARLEALKKTVTVKEGHILWHQAAVSHRGYAGAPIGWCPQVSAGSDVHDPESWMYWAEILSPRYHWAFQHVSDYDEGVKNKIKNVYLT